MELADLAHWTPIRLVLLPPEPAIDWCDLRGVRFEEPFFDQTVARWAARPVVRTTLQELAMLDDQPSLDPAGFIFHMSRCGSTVVSRLLSILPGMVVATEPGPINSLLEADPTLIHDEGRIAVLRLLIRALGRIRAGDEARYVVKLSSWNVRLLPLFRAAFPATPWIWIHRRPAEVMASILAGPPGWMQLRNHPRIAEYLFGLDPSAVPAMAPEEFCARVLASMIEAWVAAADETALQIDYGDLPGAVWDRVAPFVGAMPGAADLSRMAEEARYYAKDPTKQIFAGATRTIGDSIDAMAHRLVGPVYRRMVAAGKVGSFHANAARTPQSRHVDLKNRGFTRSGNLP
jgi:hypothetical protein